MATKELSTMEQTLLEIINKSVSAIEKGADWMAGQLPQVVEQFLMYHLIEAVIIWILSIIYLIVFVFGLKYSFSEKYGRSPFHRNEFWGFFVIFGGFFAVVDVFVCINYLLEMIKIYFAPKVYLLEWAASVIK